MEKQKRIFAWVLVFLIREPLISLFISSEENAGPEALAIGTHYLTIMCTYLGVLYLLHLYRAGLQGLGFGLDIMLAGLAELGARMAVVFFITPIAGQEGIFYAEICAWFGGFLALALFFLCRMRRLPKQFPPHSPQ